MHAAIDIGNTLAKLGLFRDDELKAHYSFASLADLRVKMSGVTTEKVIISSVKAILSRITRCAVFTQRHSLSIRRNT